MLLKEKVFVVTGASSGIGEELCMQLTKKGSFVVCAARRENELKRVASSIMENGGSSIAIPTDITKEKDCQLLIEQTIKHFGKIDGLVLNAGISMWARFEDISDIGFFKDLINVNYLGAVNCVKASLPHLKESKGKIVSCSTAQAHIGFPRHSGYAASKHALNGFLSTLAIEHKNEITILEAVLGWISGTNLRGNAFGKDGNKRKGPPKKHTKESVELPDCVYRIIRGIEKNKRTVYIPRKLSLIPFLKVFSTWYLEKKAHKAVEKNHRGD